MNSSSKLGKWRSPRRLVPITIVSLVVFGLVGFRVTSRSGVKRELGEIRKRGLPTNPVELDAWYEKVPAEQNLGLVILEAWDDHVEPSNGLGPSIYSWSDVPLGEPLRPEIRVAAADYVGKNSEILERLHSANHLKRCRFPTDLSQAPNISFGPLLPVKRLIQLLSWEAVLKAENGDAPAALQSLMSGFAVASSLKDEPLLISELVRMACMAIHLNALDRAITKLRFDDEALARLAAATRPAEEDGKRAIFRAMAGELAFGMGSLIDMNYEDFQKSIAWGGTPAGYEKLPEFLQRLLFNFRRGIGMHDRDVAFYIESMEQLAEAAKLDYPEMLRKSESVNAQIAAELDAYPEKYMISGLVLPAMGLAARKEVLLASRLRCVRAALGIERYRLQNNGNLPRLTRSCPLLLIHGRAMRSMVSLSSLRVAIRMVFASLR